MTQQSDFVMVPRYQLQNLSAFCACMGKIHGSRNAWAERIAEWLSTSPPQPAAPDVVERIVREIENHIARKPDASDRTEYGHGAHDALVRLLDDVKALATRQPAQDKSNAVVIEHERGITRSLAFYNPEHETPRGYKLIPLYTHPPTLDREKLLGLVAEWQRRANSRRYWQYGDGRRNREDAGLIEGIANELRAALGAGGV
jgi:hypothetical protein